MAEKTLETWYEIFELSADGLMKRPIKVGYGVPCNRFDDTYKTQDEADAAILEHGESYTSYVVLTMKRFC